MINTMRKNIKKNTCCLVRQISIMNVRIRVRYKTPSEKSSDHIDLWRHEDLHAIQINLSTIHLLIE